MNHTPDRSTADLWARFRFSVVGSLLSSPPARGELQAALEALAEKTWTHPIDGREIRFAAVTIERWFHQARREKQDPLGVLRRAVRKDCGQASFAPELAEHLLRQYREHPHWSYQLHYDNLEALVKTNASLGPLRSYSTVRRYMHAHGLVRKRRVKPKGRTTRQRHQRREVRSYETEYVGSLWHLDFHHASLRVLAESGQWQRPIALGILDDHSRLCCHLQWYLSETTEDLVHGLAQAIQKRGLPRALMTDNGPAMMAEEFVEGLWRLSVVHEKTLPYSPYQNGKQEAFWATLEGRLMEMLEGVPKLTLAFLNEATQAWAEIEYNRAEHREIKSSPVVRFAKAPDVLRLSPTAEALRDAFRLQTTRRQRRSDGTISLEGVRFEIPPRYRHFRDVVVRYARWDLRRVDLVDPQSGVILSPIEPLDRSSNADGRRGTLDPEEGEASDEDDLSDAPPADSELPPLLKQILQDYSATGMPPAYLPQKPDSQHEGEAS